MADLDATNLNRGPEVRWYAGGQIAQESITVTSAMVTAGGFVLAKTADYGLLVVSKNGVQIPYTGFDTDGTTAATEKTGINFVKYTGITEGDVIDLYYVDIDTQGLTHIASAEDFKTSSKADTEKKSVHGQKNKISIVGVTEHSGEFSQLMVTSELKAMFIGAITTGPKTGQNIWSNKLEGFHKIGCLVGKKYDSTGSIVHKWGLMGVSFNSHDQDFPNDGVYTDSFKVDVDWLIEWS
jgi:hypothetical protein